MDEIDGKEQIPPIGDVVLFVKNSKYPCHYDNAHGGERVQVVGTIYTEKTRLPLIKVKPHCEWDCEFYVQPGEIVALANASSTFVF